MPGTSSEAPVLVCGLGALGAECVSVLRGYGIPVRAVDVAEVKVDSVEIARGDCRDPEVLRRAGLVACRALLLVTGDSRVNIEAALAARRLDPTIRIVARAAQDNIGALVAALLGSFVSFEPSRLAASALALAAAGGETAGTFRVEGRLVRVLRRRISEGDRWQGVPVKQLGRHGVVVLDHAKTADVAAGGPRAPRALFHGHDPEAAIAAGDELTLLTLEREGQLARARPARPRRTAREILARLRGRLRRPAGVVVAALAVVTLALVVAALAFPSGMHELSRADGVFTALVLMTGGTYADLFPPFHHLSDRLRLLSVALSVVGTMFVGLLYAWLTERVMTMRLRLGARRPPAPGEAHVVVVGLGRVGRRATALLQELAAPVAAVELAAVEGHALPGLPIVGGNGVDEDTLAAANIAGARAVVATTRDEWLNLEIALQVRRLNADCDVVIRTQSARFSENIAGVVPRLQALCVPMIAARAFAAAALGGTVLELFQLGGRTVYVVEHVVTGGDGLDGRLLSEIAEGYGVVPVWCAASGHAPRFWSPAEQAARLRAGDRVVLLATSGELQRLARADLRAGTVRVRLVARRPYADPLAVAAVLVQHTGATLEESLHVLEGLPYDLPAPLHPHQAHRLKTGLEASGMSVELRV